VVNPEVYKPLTSALVHLRAAEHAGRIVQRCRPRSPACPDHRQAAIVTVLVVRRRLMAGTARNVVPTGVATTLI